MNIKLFFILFSSILILSGCTTNSASNYDTVSHPTIEERERDDSRFELCSKKCAGLDAKNCMNSAGQASCPYSDCLDECF
ncbi:MAG: hypothetical protein PHZ07_01325 [Patescibacteria group bacterium]|nr:hypothetical protein [Patescibacteria group bacterium]MDD4303922.1 hypothetical protein [Patescibacteria group bacterium]MDD4695090.1 hypothetical protein [Patescibacteria group bacterium]